MRAIYLMARREYLSYVATWGFWLSLASVPMFMLIGGLLPVLIESSEPTRYYALIDETGAGYETAVIREMEDNRRDDALRLLSAAAGSLGLSDNMPAAQTALEAQPGLEGLDAAIEAIGAPIDLPLDQVFGRFVRVEPPARTIDELRPYLLGEQLMSVGGEDVPLFAAVFFRPGGEYGVEIDYWSANLNSSRLRSDVEDAVQARLRDARLSELGIPGAALAEINSIDPEARELNPERSGATAEVSDAERVPFFVGIAFAFGLWVVVFSVTNMLLTAMIEEKGNKILETLLASARYHEILIGKLLGLAAVSGTLLLVWGALGSGGLIALQQFAQATNLPVAEIIGAIFDPGLLLPAVGYFVVGYLMFGTVYLAIGSLCDTLQEAQSLLSPIFLIMFIPLFIIMSTIDSPDSGFVQIASWIPFWTPFLMMARLQTDPSTFELIGTTIVMVTTAITVIFLASYVFRQGSMGRANASSIKKLLSFKKTKSA
ncbi:ABC transporter permease [Hyphobacterium sp.]|uniref:ABC transporter permease n=1 Tax=Hyphobacterium sp. TaxID=2004662 RepID=UPI003749BCE3